MNRNVNLLVVGDMNNETGRALTAALASDPTLAVPYRLVHIDEVRALLPGIRATPAVGVVLWADDMQEAVTIAQVAKEAAYLASQGEVTAALDYAADEVAASLPVEIYDAWTPGEHYAKDKLLQHGGKLYRVAQELDASEVYPPDSEGVLALYRPVEPSHAGTLEDPIPWVYGMDCLAGQYFSYEGKVYRVATGGDMIPCVWAPGTAGLWQWEEVG